MKTSPSQKSQTFRDAQKALDYINVLYEGQVAFLREAFSKFVQSKNTPERSRAFYPYIKIETGNVQRKDTRLSYGFVSRPGVYSASLTRPDIFGHYYRKQIELLLGHHGQPIEVGIGTIPIPLHFALGESFHLEGDLGPEKLAMLPQIFDVPDLDIMDDEIANGTYMPPEGTPHPLSLFTAPRVDLSLQRLRHYCGTDAHHFQNFVIFTNYQFYIDKFIDFGREMMSAGADKDQQRARSEFEAFVEPGNRVTLSANIKKAADTHVGGDLKRTPQMPAYHLKRSDYSGITMVNIGVGPSNAKTITDHIAVLRPHAWLMLGHCAGLRNSQSLGDYVLAHGYLREDHILDEDLHPSIPIPALAEMQQALELAVSQVTGLKGYDLKKVMRTGTVATTDDRNWELRSFVRQNQRLSQSRAVAMDMESGTIAANGFRFRVPYGTLLCVSDKPLHGQLKLPGMADKFYRERVEQHLQIGLLTMTLLRDFEPERLHSRKLRSFNEVAFQ